MNPAVDRALAAAFEAEWATIVATTIRVTGDWDLAEEVTAGAFERAAVTWPRDGVPNRPGAWLTTVARNLALDRLRRRGVENERVREWAVQKTRAGELGAEPADAGLGEPEWDDRLRLVFTCAHPALPMESRVALTLRTVGGLTTGEVAHAFMVSESTMAQRLVRAKAKIAAAGIAYRVPEPDDLPERLDGVLAVLYLIYNEGYAASSGEHLQRVDLATEAIRLTRLVADLLPNPEVVGLLALMLLQHARAAARVDAEGDLVTLEQQDRSRWNSIEIAAGLALLGAAPAGERGYYRVQAEIQAVHARARAAADTDGVAILARYDELPATPIVELNRAIAVGMARGADAGLAALADLDASGRLNGHHLLPAARADLLRRAGRATEAAEAYRTALTLVGSEPERRYLQRRLAELG